MCSGILRAVAFLPYILLPCLLQLTSPNPLEALGTNSYYLGTAVQGVQIRSPLGNS